MMRAAGFTLLELLVVVSLVVFLFVTTVETLLPLRGAAESAGFATTAGILQSATGLEAARRVLDGGEAALIEMEGGNPMDWLAVKPERYSGTIADENFHGVARGHWAYDAGNGTLFYRVRYPEYFDGSYASPQGVRFRVTVVRARGGIRGVRLEQLDTAAWMTDGSEFRRWLETSS